MRRGIRRWSAWSRGATAGAALVTTVLLPSACVFCEQPIGEDFDASRVRELDEQVSTLDDVSELLGVGPYHVNRLADGSKAAIWFSGCRTNLPEGTLGHVLMHEILVVKFDRDGLLEEIVFDSRVDQGMDDAAPGARERREPQLTPEPTR